jgi:hypothetical protein
MEHPPFVRKLSVDDVAQVPDRGRRGILAVTAPDDGEDLTEIDPADERTFRGQEFGNRTGRVALIFEVTKNGPGILALSVGSYGDVGEVAEGRCVGGDHHPSGGTGGGGNDEVVRAAGPASPVHGGEELGVHGGNVEAVVDHGDRRDDGVDELLTTGTVGARGELDANA